jgi:hypothetical protein
MALLTSEELTEEVRQFEAFGEVISDDAAATIAGYWYSLSTQQLTFLATHVNPFDEPLFDLDKLEAEARFEHKLSRAGYGFTDAEKAWHTRQFEALYAWIADKQLDFWQEETGLTEQIMTYFAR